MRNESETRRQVRAEIVRTIAEAEAAGLDGYAAAKRAFPGIPIGVLTVCLVEVDEQNEEAWWQSVERTIDGEVIRNAVAAVDRESQR